jgi:hypothetical protein
MQGNIIHFPYFNQKYTLIKTQQNRTHFLLCTNCYMFRQQHVIFRGFIKKKDYKYNVYFGAIPLALCTFSIVIWKQHVNMRRVVTDGLDRETVVAIQRVLNVVEMFL